MIDYRSIFRPTGVLFPGRLVQHPIYTTDSEIPEYHNHAYDRDEVDSLRSSVISEIEIFTLRREIQHSKPDFLNIENNSISSLDSVGESISSIEQIQRGRNSLSEQRNSSLYSEALELDNSERVLVKASPRCRNVLLVSLVVMVLSGIPLFIYFFSPSTASKTLFLMEGLEMRVDEPFQKDMSDTSSQTFRHYSQRLCHNVLESSKQILRTDNCTVISLRNGSVIARLLLILQSSQNLTQQQLRVMLTAGTEAEEDGFTRFGVLRVFNQSVDIYRFSNRPSAGTFGTVDKVDQPSGKVDCSEPGAHFRPYSYTYPAYCGEFQLCDQGISIPLQCEQGLEFGYAERHAPCFLPSPLTYCGQKRLQLNSAVTVILSGGISTTASTFRLTKPTTIPEPSQSSKPGTTLKTTIPTTDRNTKVSVKTTSEPNPMSRKSYPATSTNTTGTVFKIYESTLTRVTITEELTPVTSSATTTDTLCSGIDPRIFSDESSLYACQEHEYAVRPRNDTYPSKCGWFNWCVDGKPHAFVCSPGTSFTIRQDNLSYCIWSSSPNTFCAQMLRANQCKEQK